MTEKKSNKLNTEAVPLPMCTVNGRGKVSSVNSHMEKVILYDGIMGADIFALTGIKYDQLVEASREGMPLSITRNKRNFRIATSFCGDDEGSLYIYFIDVTEQEHLAEKFKDEKTCIAAVDVDNFDELISSTEEDQQSSLILEVDKRIRSWASGLRASVTKCSGQMYLLIFSHRNLEQAEKSKFKVLDDVRAIETQADFPVTLSIGVGVDGADLNETDIYALQALDVAKGRGGDQAVVKVKDELSYYGGKTQSVEKGNKGKSRVIGYALRGLIESASNVIIIGHRNPDMDAFGSALGIYRLAKEQNNKTYIVVDEYNDALRSLYEKARDTGQYDIIKSKRALQMIEARTLVIVLDTHRPSITECPELLEKAARLVVIDHHRKGEDFIKNPTLAYTESYASSTAELVTEILEYTIDRRTLSKLEATALLAGITVDTNRFSVKTGVRTFEAAAWLKRAGADTAEVKRLFQTDRELFKIRADCIASAQVDDNGIAYSVFRGSNQNAQIINSQVADELLAIKGVRASFVAGCDQDGKTIVSARSIGNMNVQIIMEKFNGGGHLNTAGAQIDLPPEDAIKKVKEILEREE